MSVLTERVCRTIDRYRLLPPDARVLVAVSGGADSTALVCLLNELAPRLQVELVAVAHFNHGMRGPASDGDEEFCRALAEQFRLPFDIARADVRAAARQLETSIEDAGRRLRYAFFEEARQRREATHVAVGHTRDDQAETLLLNLVRGAGSRGIGGMRPARGAIIRPLLDCSHAELVSWLNARGVPFREDESNLDRRFARNRVRHDVLPAIEAAFPGTAGTLARAANIARSDADFLDSLAENALPGLLGRDGGELTLDGKKLQQLPEAISSRVVRIVLGRESGGRFVRAAHAEELLRLAAGYSGCRLLLPGLEAVLRPGGLVVLRPRVGRKLADGTFSSPSGNVFRAALSIPGEVPVGDGQVVSSDFRSDAVPRSFGSSADQRTAVLDAGACTSLAVRFRRPGDVFRPLGMKGRKKLQDFFVDRKVPRAERGRVPLVVDADDRIAWVAGHAVSEDFRVSEATRAVVILKLRGERV